MDFPAASLPSAKFSSVEIKTNESPHPFLPIPSRFFGLTPLITLSVSKESLGFLGVGMNQV